MGAKTWQTIVFSLSMLGIGTPAVAASCASGSLASYVALGSGGCSVGALTFSDFLIEPFPSARQISPGTLSLSPLANGLSLFSATSLSAGDDELFGFRMLFSVHASSLLGGAVAFGPDYAVSGDGALTALLDAGASGNAIALVIDGFVDTPESFTSAAATSYSAFLELGIDGGTFGSASLGPQLASLTFATGSQAPVPEPEVALLTLAGLIALFVRRRSLARS